MISVKGGRPLVNHILRMCSLIGLDKPIGLVKVIIVFMIFCFKYIKNNGLQGLVIYLKACTVILQQASEKHKLESMNGLKIRFSMGSLFPIPEKYFKYVRHGIGLISSEIYTNERFNTSH